LNYIATGKNVISLRLAWASNISRDLSGIYLAAAKQLAYPHGLNLVPVPSSGQTKDHTFNFEGTVADGDGQAYSRVRGLAETAHKKAEPSGVLSPATLYVIFCRFDGGYGTPFVIGPSGLFR
jgi:hypothetical protein